MPRSRERRSRDSASVAAGFGGAFKKTAAQWRRMPVSICVVFSGCEEKGAGYSKRARFAYHNNRDWNQYPVTVIIGLSSPVQIKFDSIGYLQKSWIAKERLL